MKVVYIAGPFRGPNAWAIECNIRRAEELALWCWQHDMAAFCPHTNTRFFHGAANDEVWLQGDLEILRRCDAVLLVQGWDQSLGARNEVVEARSKNIPVFHTIVELLEWRDAIA